MTTSATVLVLLIAWALFLLILMEIVRTGLVLGGRMKSNEFLIDNANLSPFMQRLARAHANCLENLPVFGGLLLVAIAAQRSGITDPLAPWLLAARIAQSSIHLVSTSVMAVNLRFTAFLVQVGIAVFWCWALLTR